MKVTVLFGGPSDERAISLISGQSVIDALRTAGHEVSPSDVSPTDLSGLDIPCDVIFPVLHGAFGESGELQEILEHHGIPFVGSGSIASRIGIDKIATKARGNALASGRRNGKPLPAPPRCQHCPRRSSSSRSIQAPASISPSATRNSKSISPATPFCSVTSQRSHGRTPHPRTGTHRGPVRRSAARSDPHRHQARIFRLRRQVQTGRPQNIVST